MTRRLCTLERVVVTSSVRPSTKYEFSACSAHRFANGSTAIDLIAADRGSRLALGADVGERVALWRQASISERSAKTLASARSASQRRPFTRR